MSAILREFGISGKTGCNIWGSDRRDGWRGLLVRDRRPVRLASDNPLNAHILHRSRHRAAGDIDPLAAQLVPDLADAVDAPVFLEGTPDLGPQRLIAARTVAKPPGIGPPVEVLVAGGGAIGNTSQIGSARAHHDARR